MLTSRHDLSLISFGQDFVPPSVYAQTEKVYIDSIGLTAKTNTNEIAYWRDRYNDEFGKLGDRLYVLGLLRSKQAIGFALVFYFKSHHLLVVDHIAIIEPERHFGSFFYFKELIAQYVANEGLEVDYVLAEIVTSRQGDPHPIKPQLLIELLKQREFKVVKMNYYTPNIREHSYSQLIDTTLMIWRRDRGDRIQSTELLSLLKCLLQDLYLRWYTPHSKDLKGFNKQIDGLLARYKNELSKMDQVPLNGSLFPSTVLPILAKPSTSTNQLTPLLRPLVLLLAALIVAVCLSGLSYIVGISTVSVVMTFLVALFACLVLLSIWDNAASKQADKVSRLLLNLLSRHKDIR